MDNAALMRQSCQDKIAKLKIQKCSTHFVDKRFHTDSMTDFSKR